MSASDEQSSLSDKQKGVVGIFAAIFIVLIAVVVYIIGTKFIYPFIYPPIKVGDVNIKPTAPPVKVYKDTDLNFEFNYPSSDYNIMEDDEEKFSNHAKAAFRKNFSSYVGYEPPKFTKGLILKASEKGHPDQFEPVSLTIWVFDNPNNLSIDAWYQRYWYYPFVWGQFSETQKGEVKPKNISTISGQLAKYGVIPYRPGEPKFVYLANKGNMYLMRLMDEEKSGVGEKVLESFKFNY